MGVDEEFERVRTVLHAEEQAMAQEFARIEAEARATVDASVDHVRTELATQADRIREAIAQQRAEVEAENERLRAEADTELPETVLPETELPETELPRTDVTDAAGPTQEEPDDGTGDGGDHVELVEADRTEVVEHVTTGDEPADADGRIDGVERGD